MGMIAVSLLAPPRAVVATARHRPSVRATLRSVRDPPFTDTPARAFPRDLTILAIALLIWTLAGIVSADIKPSLRLLSRRKGPRQSFVTIGIRAVAQASFSACFDCESVPLILERPTMRPLRAEAASK
jgi:hypothetical protein